MNVPAILRLPAVCSLTKLFIFFAGPMAVSGKGSATYLAWMPIRRRFVTFLFGVIAISLAISSRVPHCFSAPNLRVADEFPGYVLRIKNHEVVPLSFKNPKLDQPLGVVQVLYDEDNNVHLVNAIAPDYSQSDPEQVAQKKVSHDLIVVGPNIKTIELALLRDPRTKRIAEQLNPRFVVDTKRVGDQLLLFVDEMIVGKAEGNDRDGRIKLVPFTIPTGRHVSIIRQQAQELDQAPQPLDVRDHSGKAKIIDLGGVVAPAKSLFERYQEKVLQPNQDDPHFAEVPSDFKQPFIQPNALEKLQKERDLAEKELQKLNTENKKLHNPNNDASTEDAKAAMNERMWSATERLTALQQRVGESVAGGIKNLTFDPATNVWVVEAEGQGYGPRLAKGLQGNSGTVFAPYPHKLLVVPSETLVLEFLSANDPAFKEHVKTLQQRGEELPNIPPDGSILFIDGQPVSAQRIVNPKGSTVLTPMVWRSGDHVSVITDLSQARSEKLKCVVGTAPIKRLDLLDQEVIYETLGVPPVSGGNGNSFATRIQQEAFVVLHGNGEHVANFDKSQAFQTTNIGIARVQTVDGRKQDLVPAQVVGVCSFTGGKLPGTVIVHNLLTDIRRPNISQAYEEGGQYGYSSGTSSEASSDGTSSGTSHGSLTIQFAGNVAATLYLGNSTWQESMEGPVRSFGLQPNAAGLAMIQAMLHSRRFATDQGVIGRGTELEKVKDGGHTIGYFADDHINHALQRDLGRYLAPQASQAYMETVGMIKQSMMRGWATLDGRTEGAGRGRGGR